MNTQIAPPIWTIGDRLRKAREVAGIGSAEMAERLGVSRNTIGNYERDRTPVPLMAIRLWAHETGVPVEWLTGDIAGFISTTKAEVPGQIDLLDGLPIAS